MIEGRSGLFSKFWIVQQQETIGTDLKENVKMSREECKSFVKLATKEEKYVFINFFITVHYIYIFFV